MPLTPGSPCASRCVCVFCDYVACYISFSYTIYKWRNVFYFAINARFSLPLSSSTLPEIWQFRLQMFTGSTSSADTQWWHAKWIIPSTQHNCSEHCQVFCMDGFLTGVDSASGAGSWYCWSLNDITALMSSSCIGKIGMIKQY